MLLRFGLITLCVVGKRAIYSRTIFFGYGFRRRDIPEAGSSGKLTSGKANWKSTIPRNVLGSKKQLNNGNL